MYFKISYIWSATIENKLKKNKQLPKSYYLPPFWKKFVLQRLAVSNCIKFLVISLPHLLLQVICDADLCDALLIAASGAKSDPW